MSDLLYVHWFIGIHIRKTGYNKHVYGGFEVETLSFIRLL